MISRKEFLKGAAASAAGAAAITVLGGCVKDGKKSVKFGSKYDVVVVGCGGTGVAAALEAANAGASVLVLEKAGIPGGTTNLSGGVMQAAGTEFQKKYSKYQDDSPDKHAKLWIEAGEGLVDEALVSDMAKGAPKHIEWLTGLGIKFTSVYGHCQIPYIDKSLFADRIHVYEGGGAAGGGAILVQAILKAAEAKGAKIEYDAEAKSLVTDESGAVIGVTGVKKGQEFAVAAKKGVILAAGGIDQNKEMAKALNPQQYWDLSSQICLCVATDTGDGIRMAANLGAALTGLGGTIDFCGKTGAATDNRVPLFPSFIVNKKGARFVCEDATYAYHYRAIYQQEKQLAGPTYMIFGQSSLGSKTSPWNAEVLAKDLAAKTVVTASTIEGLAKLIGAEPEVLSHTLAAWNADAKAGKDRLFDRQTGIEPISGPFYAYKNVSFNLGAIGGVAIDVDARVLDAEGKPIPRLYAGGLNAGGWIGPYYPGSGTAIIGLVHWGRKAGASAAASK